MTERWYKYRIRIAWPEDEEPRWWVDLLLIDLVFGDIAETQTIAGCPWRFHRRASREDEDGHQFSFLTLTNESAARNMARMISKNPELRRLKRLGYVERASTATLGTAMSGSSDESWSLDLQTAWPHYAQGASQMLLSLVERVRRHVTSDFVGDWIKMKDGGATVEGIYRRVEGRLANIWQEEGSHAMLHHLGALFGYNPIAIRVREGAEIRTTL